MFFLMRCMPLSEVDDFIKIGAMQFSQPGRWVNLAEGRGDYREGVYGYIKCYDQENIDRLETKYSDAEQFTKDGVVYCRRKSVMKLPTYCFYSFKSNMLSIPEKSGLHDFEFLIPDSYFKDFYKNNPDDPMHVVMIIDPQAFMDRLKDSLLKLGVKDNEILCGEVTYNCNSFKDGSWVEIAESSPRELFNKDIDRYQEQEEFRIVVNTSNKDIIKRLNDYPNPILLGNMSAYTKKMSYPSAGLTLRGQMEIEQVK